MPGGPDPLGKRALYWMPVGAEAAPDGEHDVGVGASLRKEPAPRSAPRHARPAGKHALFSSATPVGDEEPAAATAATAAEPVPRRGVLAVACSSCGSVTRIGLLDFLLLQFPVGVWWPRREFDRWMNCPACRRRTWTSVTLNR